MSDSTFMLWCYTVAGCLVATLALALYMSGATDAPTGRHRAGAPQPIPVDVPALRVPACHCRSRHTFPVTAPESTPVPAVLPEPERTPPVGSTRQEVDAAAVARERRIRWTPAGPSGEGVVPLWHAYREAAQQAQRRNALNMGTPYTYEGAHTLAGAVA
ncbi:hypothetical protein OG401_18000 [Kitasatospora purpeofusca]|uniref:hypothetical protein n=1 Tax=Kitasatospora purpeofusca TaxID=67352 RepID=UPI00224E9200|nr:hypothetical protein [Kitasatospora purpeofusca]MCX4686176.1 hypothetical protein [Kitasatospora purpeofusca]